MVITTYIANFYLAIPWILHVEIEDLSVEVEDFEMCIFTWPCNRKKTTKRYVYLDRVIKE